MAKPNIGEVIAFIGPKKVQEISGFSMRTLDRMMAKGAFPVPVIWEQNVRRWDLAQIMEWRNALLAAQPWIEGSAEQPTKPTKAPH